MRLRLILLLLAIAAVAGFTALNWSEFTRTIPLSFGVTVAQAPFGLILLGFLGVTLLVFVAIDGSHRTANLIEAREHARALAAQRELAERAEASRIAELRQLLETHLRETRQRDARTLAEAGTLAGQSHREMRNQLEQMQRSIAARLMEMEARIDARLDRAAVPSSRPAAPAVTPVRHDTTV